MRSRRKPPPNAIGCGLTVCTPLSDMSPQHVAHTECAPIQPDSEHDMGRKALQPGLRGVGCSWCGNAEAERRLHDEEREHDVAGALEQRRQHGWSRKPGA